MLKNLFEKQKKPVPLKEKLLNGWMAFMAMICLNALGLSIIKLFSLLNEKIPPNPYQMLYPDPPVMWGYEILSAVILAPLWEEIIFRVLPIQILLATGYYKKLHTPVIIGITIIFALGHSNGTFSLLIQGMSGICLMALYIRNGYSYWSCVLVHALWNTLAFFW